MPFFCIHCRSEIDPTYKACPFCGEPITDFLRRYLESPLDGKYQILARLGVGGMGEVYKALHIHLNALRVIKLMRASIANDAGAHERFQREARMATRIQHPNVAALFDFDTLDDGSRYMVWEYIEGINLHEMIDERGPLAPRYAATLAVQALHGLDAVHRAGIIHRDVSPENLMIARDQDGEERVKIIDLGIAKQGGDDADNQTKTGMFVGKWKYCSPEHLGALSDGERIDGRADIYSFGIVLYEMLTGVPPFQNDTPHGYLLSHSTERPKALREVNPSVTAAPELEALIFRAMEKDRTKRFATARDFAKAIEAIIPLLGEEPGASSMARSGEVTAEATRMSPAKQAEIAAKPVSPLAATVVNVPRGSEQLLDRDPAPPTVNQVRPARRGRLLAGLATMALLIAIAGGVIWKLRQNDTSVKPMPAAIEAGHLGLNAYPWGQLTSIRNLKSGESVAIKGEVVTPAPLDLAPGTYELTITNPAFHDAIRKTVALRAGEDQRISVTFIDPTTADLPAFAGAR